MIYLEYVLLMINLKKIAEENKLFLIEDGAQSFGGEYNKKKGVFFW